MPKIYKTIKEAAGPLIIVEKVEDAKYEELVEVEMQDGQIKRGRVLETAKGRAVVQMFEDIRGMNLKDSKARFLGKTMKLPVSAAMLGRIFDGAGQPKDNGPVVVPEDYLDVNGAPINPYSREYPDDFIQTGISTIDGLNTLVRGQKLPIFSGAGLPHSKLAAQIVRQAKVLGEKEEFAIVFGAMGITFEEAQFFINDFQKTGALSKAVVFINLADDPVIERITLPRLALTAAEYLAFEKGMHILVILSDMTNYCLTGDTEIVLGDGAILPIKDYVEKYGESGGNLFQNSVLSFDNSLHQGKIKAVQKIPVRSALFNIKTRSGAEFKATGDHKILVDTPQGRKMIPAQRLSVGDEIYSVKKIVLDKVWQPTFLDLVQDADDLYIHFYDNMINRQLREQFGSVSSAGRELNLNYSRISEPLIKRCYTPVEVKAITQSLCLGFSEVAPQTKRITSGRHKGICWDYEPVGEEFLYLLGLIASDGTWYENKEQGAYYLSFSNKDDSLIKSFENIITQLFSGINVQIHSNQNGVKIARVNSRVLTYAASKLGIKKNNDFKPIFRLPEEWIAAFLAGYFDGDGTCIVRRGKAKIVLTTGDKKNAKRLQQLLRRIGVPSHTQIRKKRGRTTFTTVNSNDLNSDKIFDIVISGKSPVCDFVEEVAPYCLHPKKKNKLDQSLKVYINSNHRKGDKFNFAPRICGKLVREIRQRYNIKQKDIETLSSTISQIENGKRRIAKSVIKKWVENLSQIVPNKDDDLCQLQNLVSDETILDEIVEIKQCEPKESFVYDLTVEPAHNFLIENGLIVSNCEALREVSAARKEVPGRRGYPGYLYTDLATLYERAGRIKGKPGSITQIPILTMPEDDITHPIPDLTGYITEGQILLTRELHNKGIYPPIDVLPSLSRLKDEGIGQGKTREDHPGLANQLFAFYARGREVRELALILGESALSDVDQKYLKFADAFEERFVKQSTAEDRTIEQTLDLGWELISLLPRSEMKRLKDEQIDKYLH